MPQKLEVDNVLNATPQPVKDQEGNASGLHLATNGAEPSVIVEGGGSPPFVVRGSRSNYGMIGIRGDGAKDQWQLQATLGSREFRIAYPQNDPKLIIQQDGSVQMPGLPDVDTAPPGANLEVVAVDKRTGKLCTVRRKRTSYGETLRSAMKTLNEYHKDAPASDRCLRVFYFSPKDKPHADDWRGRVQRMLENVSAFYGRELALWGIPNRRPQLEYDAEGRLIIHEARGDKTIDGYNSSSDAEIFQACVDDSGIDLRTQSRLIFCNLAQVDGNTQTDSCPFFGAGDAWDGGAYVLDSPFLDPANLTATSPMLTVNGESKSLGVYNSQLIGGMAHELGHGLGLPHDKQNKGEEVFGISLMGAGNFTYMQELRGDGPPSFLTFADALRLASHPIFTRSLKKRDADSSVQWSDIRASASHDGFTVTGRIQCAVPIYAVVAYMDPYPLVYEGGRADYDATTSAAAVKAVANESDQFTFSLTCPQVDLVRRREAGELRLVALLANGYTNTRACPLTVPEQGPPDVSQIR